MSPMSLVPAVQPWYREPWPWIVMAGPAVVVVAGIITAYLAFSSADGLVADDYYKRGLAINRTLERNGTAIALGLEAELSRTSRDEVVVRLRQKQSADLPAGSLRLQFVHPTRASEDRVVHLVSVGPGHYAGRLAVSPGVHWRVVLETPQWRLQGIWPASGEPVLLAPKI